MSVLRSLCLPILITQGLWARRQAPTLPEPEGPRVGQTGDGPVVRLLIVGDSSAAGVGVAHQQQALSGQLLQHLSPKLRVDWRLAARTGNTTREALTMLRPEQGRFDVAIAALGVNDVTRGVPLRRFLRQQAELRRVLKTRFGVRQIIVSALPPMHQFPLLPQPTRWLLGREARLFDNALRQAVAGDPIAEYLPFDMSLAPSLMAEDGFHPGPKVYSRWGELVAARILAHQGENHA